MDKNKTLDVKIFEDLSAAGLSLSVEQFLRAHPDIDVTNMAYAVQKKKEAEPFGYYSCILIYRQR